MPGTAERVARQIIYLASQEVEPSLVTHLQVQKLLYYAQGWCLVRSGRVLFQERIEAWEHGPVVADVYSRFKKFENRAIGVEEGRDDPSFAREDRATIEAVWKEYGKYSASGLRDMTHAEAPWKDARKGLAEGTPSKEPITEGALLAFFKAEQEKRLKKMGIDPVELETAIKEAREGKTIPWQVMKRELRESAPAAVKAAGDARAPELPATKRAAG